MPTAARAVVHLPRHFFAAAHPAQQPDPPLLMKCRVPRVATPFRFRQQTLLSHWVAAMAIRTAVVALLLLALPIVGRSEPKNLLSNADFSAAGGGGRSPAAEWLTEGASGYTLVMGVRHGTSGGSIRAHASNASTLAGAVQVFRPPSPGQGGQRQRSRLLRVSGWSKAEGVTGVVDANYAISCDLAFADGSHHYGVAVAPFEAGTHDWQHAEATFELPASAGPLATVSFYLLFRSHIGTVFFSDVACTLAETGPPPPTPPSNPPVKERWAVFSAYGAGDWSDPACPGGCPQTNAFGRVANTTNGFFSPWLNLQTADARICPADFDPAADNGTCLPDPRAYAAGAMAVPLGRRALWMGSNPTALYSVNRLRSSTVGDCTRDGACSPAMTICSGAGPNASCGYWLDEIADGFSGPWSDKWQQLSAARFDIWMGRYKATCGTLDWLYQDNEDRPGPDDLSWDYIAHQKNGSGVTGAGDAIEADPRWSSLRAQLTAVAQEAGCKWEGSLSGWMAWQPTDCRTLVWNEVMQNVSAAAINAAVYTPTLKHFPSARGANVSPSLCLIGTTLHNG
jgi:hypothetical protein